MFYFYLLGSVSLPHQNKSWMRAELFALFTTVISVPKAVPGTCVSSFVKWINEWKLSIYVLQNHCSNGQSKGFHCCIIRMVPRLPPQVHIFFTQSFSYCISPQIINFCDKTTLQLTSMNWSFCQTEKWKLRLDLFHICDLDSVSYKNGSPCWHLGSCINKENPRIHCWNSAWANLGACLGICSFTECPRWFWWSARFWHFNFCWPVIGMAN